MIRRLRLRNFNCLNTGKMPSRVLVGRGKSTHEAQPLQRGDPGSRAGRFEQQKLIASWALGPTLIRHDLISRFLVTSAKTLFPNKVIFTGSRDLKVHIYFGVGIAFNTLHHTTASSKS